MDSASRRSRCESRAHGSVMAVLFDGLPGFPTAIAPALHAVVGGHLGVFEGNTGDLRIGLPRQSVHDGVRSMHTPLRLSVYVEAPAALVDSVIGADAQLRRLLAHEWLHLLRIDDCGRVAQYRGGRWIGACEAAAAGSQPATSALAAPCAQDGA